MISAFKLLKEKLKNNKKPIILLSFMSNTREQSCIEELMKLGVIAMPSPKYCFSIIEKLIPRSNDNYVQAFKSHLPMLLEWKKKYDRNIFEIILYQGGCWYFDDDNDVNFRYEYNKLNNSTYCYFYYK